MHTVHVVFPHQLFEESPLAGDAPLYVLEEHLFFRQYAFHRQKIAYHRATMKMSDYPKGDWQATWDALFWRFLHVNRDFFLKNPRLGMPSHPTPFNQSRSA